MEHKEEGRPLLLIVTGPPGAGKTTLSRSLAAELRLPLVAKDAIKESLYDSLGVGDRAWSQRLGRATFPLLFQFLGELLGAAALRSSRRTSPTASPRPSSPRCRGTASSRSAARRPSAF